jgi:phosphoribosylaminoimidazole (AIR) synthetase
MNTILKRLNLTKNEAYQTFNMGIGLVICARDMNKLTIQLNELKAKFMILGEVTDQQKGLIF